MQEFGAERGRGDGVGIPGSQPVGEVLGVEVQAFKEVAEAGVEVVCRCFGGHFGECEGEGCCGYRPADEVGAVEVVWPEIWSAAVEVLVVGGGAQGGGIDREVSFVEVALGEQRLGEREDLGLVCEEDGGFVGEDFEDAGGVVFEELAVIELDGGEIGVGESDGDDCGGDGGGGGDRLHDRLWGGVLTAVAFGFGLAEDQEHIAEEVA